MSYSTFFQRELIDAGVGGLPFGWSDDGTLHFGDSITAEQRAIIERVAAANLAAPVPPSVLVARYEALLDQHLDAVAQKYRYADRTRLALRAGYPNEDQLLAIAFGTWMDRDCNRPAKQLMIDVMAGKKPMPTEAEFIAGLLPFVPPAGF